MPEPPRPDPDPPLAERLREWVPDWIRAERLRDRVPDWSPPGRERSSPVGLVLLVVVGAGLLVGGGVWGWRAWSGRSAPPIDDLLPVLVAGDQHGDLTDAAGDEASEADPVDDVDEAGDRTVDRVTAEADAGSEPTSVVAIPSGVEPLDRRSPDATLPREEATPGVLVVHVSGAVLVPGVVEVRSGARVYEAVAAAGGETATADLDRLNLAAPLLDGDRIHVPAVGEGDPPELIEPDRPHPVMVSPVGESAGEIAPTAAPLFFDLNRATTAELEQLPGVGPTIAASIVALRDARGPYAEVDELLLVDGIGPTKLEAIRPFVWVRAG